MAASKSATLTFRIDPGLKEALCVAADREHRSIANMVEVLIRDYCEQRGIANQDPASDRHGCPQNVKTTAPVAVAANVV